MTEKASTRTCIHGVWREKSKFLSCKGRTILNYSQIRPRNTKKKNQSFVPTEPRNQIYHNEHVGEGLGTQNKGITQKKNQLQIK